MATGARREDDIIRTFLAGYEDRFWDGIEPRFPDKEEDGGIDGLAQKEGRTRAIEHTIIEPFVGEMQDRAKFDREIRSIRDDATLAVTDRIIYVFVPIGAFDGHKKKTRAGIVASLHSWLQEKLSSLEEGDKQYPCEIRLAGRASLKLTLTIRVVASLGPGGLIIARQQMSVDLDKVVKKALEAKLPKLIATDADKRILMLERQHMNSTDDQILDEIEKVATGRELSKLDEIWFVETLVYETEGILYFYQKGLDRKLRGTISAVNGKVRTWWDESMPYGKWER